MGFRNGAYATVWEVKPRSANVTTVRIAISKKDKESGGYTQTFSGFVSFVGAENASNAAGLHEKDRIKLGDVDVTTTYNAERKITYTNYACFGFERAEEKKQEPKNEASEGVNPVEEDGILSDGEVPF